MHCKNTPLHQSWESNINSNEKVKKKYQAIISSGAVIASTMNK